MSVFTIIIIGILLWNLVIRKGIKQQFINILALNFFIGSYISGNGTFINIAGFSVTHIVAIKYITLVYAIFLILYGRVKFPERIIKNSFFLIGSLTVGLLMLMIWNYKQPIMCALSGTWDQYFAMQTSKTVAVYSSFNTEVFLHTAVFIFITLVVYSVLEKKDYECLIDKLVLPSKALIILGFVEIFMKDVLHSSLYNKLLTIFLGQANSTTIDTLYKRGALYRLQGLSTEASVFIISMFVCCLIFLKKKEKKWIMLSIILMLFSTAFTAIAMLAVFTAYYILYTNRENKKLNTRRLCIWIGSIFVGIVLVVALIVSDSDLLNFGFLSNTDYGQRITDGIERLKMLIQMNYGEQSIPFGINGSTYTRMVSSIETLKLLMHRPLFGFGIGTFSNFGYTSNLLSSLGIVGFMAWNRLLFYGNIPNKSGGIRYLTAIVLWYTVNLFLGGATMEMYREMNILLVILMQDLFLEKSSNITSTYVSKTIVRKKRLRFNWKRKRA